ncbi:RNA polymerase II elongator complex subunit [Tieghemostelium lacteum]|uniref:Elongator complex protein 4 n=1 Tax=Tieghemostelium lacteum TaxID=361077 RepID=A0A151ZAD1_TIELA|nr:RNA polymerase II elongator complex subunit [Tieghemostelium lacteum]|eukprot:KYQ90907.1 RNA polymerase II elongator complex subunit [Tieghemostelium lacteum]
MNKTTFIRKNAPQVPGGASGNPSQGVKKLPNGCKLSIQNGNLLTSSGLQDLDDIIGGGIPVGSILMIEEDINSSYYMFLLKYFLAEGILQQHGTFFTSLIGLEPFEILNKLPARITKEEEIENDKLDQSSSSTATSANSGLDIAWRYQQYVQNELSKQQQQQQLQQQTYCHSYDFTRKLNINAFSPDHTHTLTYSSTSQVEGSSPYRNLFLEIQNLVYKYNAESAAHPDNTKILRIGLQSFSSPLWSNDEEGVIEFLHSLKGLLRSSLSVCVITVPTYIYSQSFVKKISHLCDTVVSLNSFQGLGGETPEQFQDYIGLFNIKKIARLNTLSLSFHPEMLTYVFKMKRRAMCIERIHLPPEFSRAGDSTPSKDTSKSDQKESIVSKMKSGSGLLCSTGPSGSNKSLDF